MKCDGATEIKPTFVNMNHEDVTLEAGTRLGYIAFMDLPNPVTIYPLSRKSFTAKRKPQTEKGYDGDEEESVEEVVMSQKPKPSLDAWFGQPPRTKRSKMDDNGSNKSI